MIRVRPPDCHHLPVQSKKTPWKKQERACCTHTYPSEGSPDSKNVPLPPWLPCCRQTSNRWWCSVLQGWWRITRGSELPTARRSRLFAAFSSRRCLRGWARPGTASSALSRELPALWHHGVPLGRKFQKRNKNLAAWPWPRCACSHPDCSHRAWTSRTEQARECICFSLKQLSAISIYIQMTAIQRERRFGWELGVPCITTLFRVSIYHCHTIPVKIPVEVNN